MNAISPGLRRYSVKPASSPSTRISKRWRSGSSTTVTSAAVVAAIRKEFSRTGSPRWRLGFAQLFRVLVFPSANEPGLEIIRSLAGSNKVELFGGSSYEVEYDPSRPLLRNHLRCPALGEPGFRDELEWLLDENEINVLFPTVDAVVAEVASWKLSDVAVIAPSPETARVLLSKRATYRALKGAASVPSVFDDGEVPLPAFAKPDEGSGSTGAIELRTEADLVRARDQSLLVHQNLPGAEYTVDCLGDPDGKLLVANVRLRARVSRGMSLATEMVER